MLLDESTLWHYSAGRGDPSPSDAAQLRQVGFDDSAWFVASGRFGAKNGQIAAMGEHTPTMWLPMADESGACIPAYFFRASFTVDDPAQIPALEGELSYDDAVIVYINGEAVFSGNVPEGGFSGNDSFGAGEVEDTPRAGTFRVPANMLHAGENTVAVELHQAGETSTDIYFAFHRPRVTHNTGTLSGLEPCLFAAGADGMTVRWFGDGRDMTFRYTDDVSGANTDSAQTMPVLSDRTEQGVRYSVSLTGPAPKTQYSYWIEDDQGRNHTASFKTAGRDSFSFLLAGDPQLTDEASATAFREALSMFPNVSFALCAGDSVNSSEDVSQYRMFLDAVAESRLPVTAVIGNHESPVLYDLFLAPEGLPSLERSFRFSYGNTLFVCLDSTAEDYKAQEVFLSESIAAGDWDWVIVCMHYSLFSMGEHADSESIAVRRDHYAPMFAAYDVDLVLSGHDHIYARTTLMENDTPSPNAANDANTLEKTPGQTLYVSAVSSSGSKFYQRSKRTISPLPPSRRSRAQRSRALR